MSHKEMTAQIRSALKTAGVASRVRLYAACGVQCVQVSVRDFQVKFTDAQQESVKDIARSFGLTGARGSAILMGVATNPDTFNFEFWG